MGDEVTYSFLQEYSGQSLTIGFWNDRIVKKREESQKYRVFEIVFIGKTCPARKKLREDCFLSRSSRLPVIHKQLYLGHAAITIGNE
jgi:hypothetical protein